MRVIITSGIPEDWELSLMRDVRAFDRELERARNERLTKQIMRDAINYGKKA